MTALIDETGNKYGRLTVLCRAREQRWGNVLWECACECGREVVANGSKLRSGETTSCGCLRSERISELKLKDETGNRYGRLQVIERAGMQENGDATWLCICDCGESVEVRGTSLRQGKVKSCGCLHSEQKLAEGEAAFNNVFLSYQRSAKRRGISWQITREQARRLFQEECYYCGALPGNVHQNPTLNGDYQYNGIDRVDNEAGYSIENVVACCKFCNYAKADRTVEEFEEWAARLYHNLASRGKR